MIAIYIFEGIFLLGFILMYIEKLRDKTEINKKYTIAFNNATEHMETINMRIDEIEKTIAKLTMKGLRH